MWHASSAIHIGSALITAELASYGHHRFKGTVAFFEASSRRLLGALPVQVRWTRGRNTPIPDPFFGPAHTRGAQVVVGEALRGVGLLGVGAIEALSRSASADGLIDSEAFCSAARWVHRAGSRPTGVWICDPSHVAVRWLNSEDFTTTVEVVTF